MRNHAGLRRPGADLDGDINSSHLDERHADTSPRAWLFPAEHASREGRWWFGERAMGRWLACGLGPHGLAPSSVARCQWTATGQRSLAAARLLSSSTSSGCLGKPRCDWRRCRRGAQRSSHSGGRPLAGQRISTGSSSRVGVVANTGSTPARSRPRSAGCRWSRRRGGFATL